MTFTKSKSETAYQFTPGGLQWSKIAPATIEGSSPATEPYYAVRVSRTPKYATRLFSAGEGWFVSLLDVSSMGGTFSSLEDAIRGADELFIEYKESFADQLEELEVEIANVFSKAPPNLNSPRRE